MTYQTPPQAMYISRRQSFASASDSKRWSRNQNMVAYVSAVRLGPVMHTILVALMVTIIGLVYLTQATRATSYDYAAQKIDDQISQLTVQKNDLEVENARITALENVQKSDVAKAMTTPDKTNFIK